MENKEKFVKGIFLLLMFVAVLFAGALLKVMESVFKPLVLSIMLSFVFYPFIKKMLLSTMLCFFGKQIKIKQKLRQKH